jgi:hypothetical protein
MLIYKKAELLNFSIYWNIRTQRRFATMPVGQWTGHDTYAKGGGGRRGASPLMTNQDMIAYCLARRRSCSRWIDDVPTPLAAVPQPTRWRV